jgi:AcrR family transcriptional regulator
MPEINVRNRRTRPDTRRRELVDAALAAFATRGIAGTSVDDIVKTAGAAKGTFYLYFSTKDDAVTAVAERMVIGVGLSAGSYRRPYSLPAVLMVGSNAPREAWSELTSR